MPRRIIILGSTGSIGTQALDVIRAHPSAYCVGGLGAAGAHPDILAQQAYEFSVPIVALSSEKSVDTFRAAYRKCAQGAREPEIFSGPDAMVQLAAQASGSDCTDEYDGDVVLNGMAGSVGLLPTLAALRTGATLALANKESLVAGGALVQEAMVRPGQIVPVDSEHSAIHQALQAGIHHRGLTSENLDGESNVRKIILTASGGPFRGRSRSELADVSVQQALHHPTWNMGPVVTINSASLMNKALELIEAAYLFDIAADDIVPVIHPQSVVHSAVEFIDGSTLAQLSPPDMRLPIALGLSWPKRVSSVAPAFPWHEAATWTFEPLDHDTFPSITLARAALAQSPVHPAVLNAANEEAVAAFVRGELGFLAMADVVRHVLELCDSSRYLGSDMASYSVEAVLEAEAWARKTAHKVIK